MMLSVLVWLAMWGQVQKPWDNPIYDDPGIVQPLTCNYCGQYVPPVPVCTAKITDNCISPDGNTLYGCRSDHDCAKKPKPKPAEHVIEIKTVLQRTGPFCPDYKCSCEKGYSLADSKCKPRLDNACFAPWTCERVTRELWIDGVRWGVVKGLD